MRQRRVYLGWILGASVLVFFTNLGGAALWDDDEPYYASCAREMIERNDWVVPMFNGSLFPDKPPLMFWTMICGFKLFGMAEFGARFGAALCGVATVLATYALGRRLFAPEVGLWGGLIVASNFLFTISARAATVDSALALLSVLAMLAFTKGMRDEGGGMKNRVFPSSLIPQPSSLSHVLMWACLAVGVLAKGPIGLLLPAASIGLYLMVMNHIEKARQLPDTAASAGWVRLLVHAARLASPGNFLKSLWQMRPLLGVVVVLAAALPWFVLVSLRTDGQWPAEFFGNYNLRPFMKPILGHAGPFWYYVPAILIGFFPWSVFMAPTLTDAVRRVWQSHPWGPGYLLLACWMAVPIIFWSICSSKLPHYMVPITPALALAVGAFLHHWFREPALFGDRLLWLAWGITMLAGVGFMTVIPILAPSFLPGEGLLGMVGLILIAGGAVSLYLVRQQRRQEGMIVFASMAALLMTAVFGFASLRVDRHQNTRALMAAIRQDCPGEPRLAAYRFLEKSQVFYAGHSVPLCQDTDDLSRVVGDSLTYVFTDDNGAAELQARLPGVFEVLIEQRRFLRRGKVLVLVHHPYVSHGRGHS